MRENVLPNVEAATENYPDYRFIVTGHSLGAALATIAAGDIRKAMPWLADRTELFSYGSPRVGNIVTADFLTKQSDKNYRITSTSDPVPRVPGPTLDYMHTSPEYWISMDPDNESPDPMNIWKIVGYFNENGNTGTKWTTFDTHRHYFGFISGCDPGTPKEDAWYIKFFKHLI